MKNPLFILTFSFLLAFITCKKDRIENLEPVGKNWAKVSENGTNNIYSSITSDYNQNNGYAGSDNDGESDWGDGGGNTGGNGGSAGGDECDNITGTFDLISVDGKMPYYSVYIDSENYSKVHSGMVIHHADGTWESELYYDVSVKGEVEENKVAEGNGTYTCADGEVTVVNDKNGASGVGTINGNKYTLVSTNGLVYEYEK